MDFNFTVGISLTAIITVITHGGATIWWASKVSTTMSFIREEIKDFNHRTDERHNENKIQLKALLDRISDLDKRLTVLESKIK